MAQPQQQSPPADVERYVATSNFHDRVPSTQVPTAHTIEACPFLGKADEYITVKAGEETPKVEARNTDDRFLSNTRTVTLPWCRHCQKLHE